MNYVWVGLGAALGGVARYGIGQWVRVGAGFPWATLLINLAGSLLLGLLSGLLARGVPFGADCAQGVRCFAVVGLCGGFTTFSTFSNEAFRLLAGGQWMSAWAYVAVSCAGGLVCVGAGHGLVRGLGLG